MVLLPKLNLPENQKGTLSSTTKSPFVIGATLEGKAQRPHIVVVQDGLWVEIMIGGRQPDGASVDVTVEQSKIGDIETKKLNPSLTIQKPHVDCQKKRFIDFVKYGEVFSIHLGETKSAACIEMLIQADDKTAVPENWTLPTKSQTSCSKHSKRTEIFGEILSGGGAELRYEKEGYSLTLFDSPTLLKNVRLLGDVPELWNLTIGAEECNYTLMHDLTKINVRHNLRFLGMKGEMRIESEEIIGQDRLAWHLYHDAPGYAKMTLAAAEPPPFTVYAEDAETAIPALRNAAHVKQVLLVGAYKDCDGNEADARVEQAKQMMQKALPNMKITTFVFTGGNRPSPR